MQFCEDCDSLLQPKKVDGQVVPYCPDCDEFKKSDVDVSTSGTISVPNDEERKKDPEGGKMLILENESKRVTGRPSRVMYCDNCESREEVEYWEIQTRSADEPPTRFFRCLNCDKNWREYD